MQQDITRLPVGQPAAIATLCLASGMFAFGMAILFVVNPMMSWAYMFGRLELFLRR